MRNSKHKIIFTKLCLYSVLLFLIFIMSCTTYSSKQKNKSKHIIYFGELTIYGDPFYMVRDVAVDSAGNVYAIAPNRYQIISFNNQGEIIDIITLQERLINIEIDVDDFIYLTQLELVVEDNGYTILDSEEYLLKLDKTGILIEKWRLDKKVLNSYITDFTIDSDGNFYILENDSIKLKKYNNKFELILEWVIADNKQITVAKSPIGITVDSNKFLYIVDSGTHQVFKFDSFGHFITQWGGSGTKDGEFLFPTGIGVSHNDIIYISDSKNYRIQLFDSEGKYLFQFGSKGNGEFQFEYPSSIAVDKNNFIYICDEENHRIVKYKYLNY